MNNMAECDAHQGCQEGYIGVDYGSTFTSGSYAIPIQGVYDLHHVTRIKTAESYLDISSDATAGNPTELRYPHLDQPKTVLDKLMEFPKVLLMDRCLKRMDETDLYNDVVSSWKGIECPNDYLPSALFLEGYCNNVLRDFRNEAGVNKRPALILTYPSGFTREEFRQFEKAVEASKIKQHVCPTCGITYLKEGEAAVLAALKDHDDKLLHAHKNNEAVIVADYGGITDDIITFRFDRSLGGKSTLPGTIVSTECGWTGARVTEYAFKAELLKAARAETGRQDKEFTDEIQKDLHEAGRKWVKDHFPLDNTLDIVHPGLQCRIGEASILVRREAIQRVIDASAEAKADVLLAIIKTEAKVPKYLVLVGGFSKCTTLYDEVLRRLSQKLGAQDPPIAMPQILEHKPDKDPQLSVSRGIMLSKMSGFLDKYAPSTGAVAK